MQLNEVINTTRLLQWSTVHAIRSHPQTSNHLRYNCCKSFFNKPYSELLNSQWINDWFFSRDYCLQKQNPFLVYIGVVWNQQVAANNRNLTQIITLQSVFMILPPEGLVTWRKRSAVFFYCSNWTFTTCYQRIHTHFFSVIRLWV